MDAKYNLLEESWINAIDLTGKKCVMGIKQLLRRADELEAIIDSSPVVQYSIYRMLIAFIMDAFFIQDIEEIEEIIDNGQFNKEIIDNYSKKWYNRFDLFDSEYPFYQSPPSQHVPSKTKNISELFLQFPTGINVIHFYHMKGDEHAISPEICAKGLCTIPAFALAAGRGYSPSINGTPPWYVLVLGNNLFETLVLNTCGMSIAEASGSGSVAWRCDEPIIPKMEVTEVSLVEGLTFQPRYICLIPSEGGRCTYTGKDSDLLVSEIFYQPGLKWKGNWRDPHVAYKFDGNKVFGVKPQEGREIWRDTGPLALLKRKDSKEIKYDRPIVVTQFGIMEEMSMLEENKSLKLEIYGARVKAGQAKVFEWQHTYLTLPIKLILSEESGIVLQKAMEHAEKVHYAIQAAIKTMYPREGKSNKKAFGRIKERASRRFWKTLEPLFKEKFLLELSRMVGTSDWKPLEAMWKEILRNTGNYILNETIGPLDTDADFIKRQVQAEQEYSKRTYKMFKDLIQQNKTKK